jgi:hypothetical protein
VSSPTAVATIPTPDEHRKLWSGLEFKQRRQILKAVGRGQAVQDRRVARIAVGTARQQQRYWRWAWIWGLGPAILVIGQGLAVLVVYMVLGLLMMGALSWWRLQKARESERLNLELLSSKKKRKKKS